MLVLLGTTCAAAGLLLLLSTTNNARLVADVTIRIALTAPSVAGRR
jgi:hypothetical protein